MQILETYDIKIDAKGRVALPVGLKKSIGEIELQGGFFIRRSMCEDCLEMYTAQSWSAELEKVQSLNPYVREQRSFIRRFMAGVRFVEVDAVGRVNIPSELTAWAKIEREVVLSPVGSMFEVWAKDRYEEALLKDEANYAEMAERIMSEKDKNTNE
ncbi:MAG: division/cell wall cluster transcriptional repressor MraZ [Flavobacteriales bacterium]|nr:division/cell wall cluster transcriptional repressor MraZ [Flavobacteriales bacterium]